MFQFEIFVSSQNNVLVVSEMGTAIITLPCKKSLSESEGNEKDPSGGIDGPAPEI